MTKPLTPAMKQYYEIKAAHQDALLFFRMGDFYEMFDEDAHIAGKELGLTVTTRNKNSSTPTPLAGIPYHAAEKYLLELTKRGYKVAIAEQVSDPSLPGIVERAVARIVTPGTILEEHAVEGGMPLHSIAIVEEGGKYGLAGADLSTGAFTVELCTSLEELYQCIFRLTPREVVMEETALSVGEIQQYIHTHLGQAVTFFSHTDTPLKVLEGHFGKEALGSFDMQNEPVLQGATALLLSYFYHTQKNALPHIRGIRRNYPDTTMHIDEGSIRHLELLWTEREGAKRGSVLALMDLTVTAHGGRLLKEWIVRPLRDKEKITRRLEIVDFLYKDQEMRTKLRKLLAQCFDTERVLARLACNRGNPRDMEALRKNLALLPDIRKELGIASSSLGQFLQNTEKEQALLTTLLNRALEEELPLNLQEGGFIRKGYDAELDALKERIGGARSWMMAYQVRLQEETGISSLKIQFNKIFGFYIEVTHTHREKVPSSFERKQTLVNAERYTTPELKEYEDIVVHGEERMKEKEWAIFEVLRGLVLTHIDFFQTLSKELAEGDIFCAFAERAHRSHFVCPTIHEGYHMEVEEGRHPVVEHLLEEGNEKFIPNNLTLKEEEYIHVITGPNMAGKSTYLRQNALILLLAQIGSFVPAKRAVLPIVDRIFTRVGAGDNLSRGQSTFMVEMQEAAYILHNATEKSFIILDEIGRGTSTYDGLALAWAILKHLHTEVKAKVLFATHYHELIEKLTEVPSAKNYSVAVTENNEGVIFLHKILPGGISKSYGIEVAKRAGLPKNVIKEAEETLQGLERKKTQVITQLSFLAQEKPPTKEKSTSLVEAQLAEIEVDTLTPKQALERLYEWKTLLEQEKKKH